MARAETRSASNGGGPIAENEGQKMSNKPQVLWLDQLAVSENAEIPGLLPESFSVHPLTGAESLDSLIAKLRPAAVFFDFDYPDKHRLSLFEKFKQRYRSIPAVFATLQHSEQLAIWAFRNGALDFLVKPIREAELRKCISRILRIAEYRTAQPERHACLPDAQLPYEVPTISRSTKSKLSPAIFYVRQNYAERISSDAMARLCGMSAAQFSRSFKQSFHITFHDFLLRYRIRQACRHLRNPNVTVADSAYAVGFTDPSYFTRVFKRCTGRSPSEYSAALPAETAANEDLSGEFLVSSSQIVRRLAVETQS